MNRAVRNRLVLFLLALGVSPGQQPAPDASPATFRAQTRLVLLSFHVARGRNYVRDLKPADVVLLEDGKPRDFTIFDGPDTQGRMPLELVLLFDTNPRINYFWDPVAVYRFIPEWTAEMSRGILTENRADLRVSVYRCSGQKLYPMLRAGSDATQLTETLRSLLKPRPAGEAIALSLPENRSTVARGPFTNDYPTSPFISQESRGWPMEAAISTLHEMAAAQDKVARLMVISSEGIGATTTIPEDIGNQALDLGIPIYPVATNYLGHIDANYPRNFFRMGQFKALGKMTGGRDVEWMQIDAATLRDIVEGVKNHGLTEYIVGFAPSGGQAPRQHRLEIKRVSKKSGSLEGGKRRANY